ncbi:MAG TPA: hypothetical protein VET65_10210 [Candidatus Limnocylindrales bacterium]|nr:hypothetical protein [Candidatus Limnocylindrales bacterium]
MKATTSTSSRARRPRDPRLPDAGLRRALVLPLILLAFLAMRMAALAATPADDYASAALRTLTYVRFAENGDLPSVPRAIAALQPIASTQPEILADLQQTPPNLSQADQRLSGLLDALRNRVDVADPRQAESELHRVMAMPRYAGLFAPTPWWQQALGWLLQQIARLLSLMGAGHLAIPPLAVLLGTGIVLLAIAAWLARSLLGRAAGDRRRPLAQPGEAAIDYFALADRQAAAGDFAAALRALAAAVGVAIGGPRAWTSSPLTVRELFQRASAPVTLRPLLSAFEATEYGHRLPDADAYARAAAAAARYRARPA